jgi:hypothetical protein
MADGFLAYRPIKQVTMVRRLPPEIAPKTRNSARNTIIIEADCWIAYEADDVLKATLNDYKPRPIEPDIFVAAYRVWDEPDWHPSPIQSYLRRLGCQPYYNIAGVWAKRLVAATWVQSRESAESSLVSKGAWLCVGMEGEPWSMTNALFEAHYLLPGYKTGSVAING